MIIDTNSLVTASNYAKKINVNRFKIYRMIKAAQLIPVEIDGILFINDPKIEKK